VIWQLGTNAVLRRDDLEMDEVLLRRGVSLLKQSGADIVLMDMQYAPRVIERRSYATMQQLIAEIAHHTGVGLFRRFALMQYWRAAPPSESPPMVGADGLHMTDAGYGCLAASLAEALALNWKAHRAAAEHTSNAAKIADVVRSGSAATGAR
jgi:acyl-CoA thioesterase I